MGVGLGRHGGWVIMVPFALPGELVQVSVWRNHKNYSEADLREVLEPSPHRVKPLCPLFGQCGGCQYQNLAYTQQLQWKTRHVRELLLRIGGLDLPVAPTHPSPLQYGYRTKITPHFGAPRAGENIPIGFLRFGSRQLLDVPRCPIATEAINERLTSLRAETRVRALQMKRGGTLLLRDTADGVITDMKTQARVKIGQLELVFPAGEFFQNNAVILPELIGHVLAQAARPGLRFLLDAYCGCGVFGLAGATHFEQCLGVEISELSVAAAKSNALRNGITNCTFQAARAEAIFAGVMFPPEQTVVILDPPREGCDIQFLEQLVRFSPARIVYVSCDPATQARDLKFLCANGFAVELVQPFDLFPQTRHLESVATLQSTIRSAYLPSNLSM